MEEAEMADTKHGLGLGRIRATAQQKVAAHPVYSYRIAALLVPLSPPQRLNAQVGFEKADSWTRVCVVSKKSMLRPRKVFEMCGRTVIVRRH